jgi:predicted flap endonuclease-1-like 5' DNA nuclease
MPNGWGKGKRVTLKKIEGIGSRKALKLKKAGIRSVHGLILKAADPKGRQEVSQSTGFSTQSVLEWVNRADLFRVKGIGEQYSDLLEKAGVDSTLELAKRQPANLYTALVKANEKLNLVNKLPTETQVADWVKHAKTLKRVIKY